MSGILLFGFWLLNVFIVISRVLTDTWWGLNWLNLALVVLLPIVYILYEVY